MPNLIQIKQIPGGNALEENTTHTNRFEIASSSSNRIYIFSQCKATGEWQCSCPAWIIKKPGKERTCPHVRAIVPVIEAALSEAVVPKRIEAAEEKKADKKKGRKIQI